MEIKGSACGLTDAHRGVGGKPIPDILTRRDVIPIEDGWTFKQVDDESYGFLPVAQFPSNIHLDLMYHGLIPDPFVGKNETDVQWVGERDWVYKTSFSAPHRNGRTAVIAFDGLDTYAQVRLNGRRILLTQDMFIPERVDVSDDLKLGSENILEITFNSAWLIGQTIRSRYPEHKWGCWNGDNSRLAIRKAQYHYGWDWGPMLMTCGPWRPINLEIYSSRIADLYFTTKVDKSLRSAEIVAKADIEGKGLDVRFAIHLDDQIVCCETVKVKDGFATATFRTRNPELWYPSKYGSQPLYVLKAALLSGGSELDTVSKRFGLRRAEVIQEKLDTAPGMSFYFKINNIPIFCGGCNWIPADNFLPRISPQKYRDWIKLVIEGNQIMIRVWGGGIFEGKAFYDACDEMGVLVWQDFLFACGNYPADHEFLALVEREARENVKILRHHPSIVIYAGNNEDYQYRETENLNYDADDENPSNWLKTTFPARYIYEKILVDVTQELVPGTYYHFGSPYGGKSTADPTVGDIHQWNVWHGVQEKYQNFDKLGGRFVSEFGMQGFPAIKTVDSYLRHGKADPDRYAQSSTVDFHNKAAGQERRLALYLMENIRCQFEPLERFTYCTQLMQAECLATAYRLWRREWKGPGREYCAGALVWQLNDCWPCTSWAIVDYYLRPKPAYFVIKRELSPITIGLKRTVRSIPADKYRQADVKTVHTIEMWASNLSLDERIVTVQLQAWDVVTGSMIYSHCLPDPFTIGPNRSTEITEFDVPVQEKDVDQEQRTVVAAYLVEKGVQIARCVNWPEPLKHVQLRKPKALGVKLADGGDGLEIWAEVPIKGVVLEAVGEGVVWADNCVDVVPGETVVVGVKGLERGEVEGFVVRYLNRWEEEKGEDE